MRKIDLISVATLLVVSVVAIPTVSYAAETARTTNTSSSLDYSLPVNTVIRGKAGSTHQTVRLTDVADGSYKVRVVARNQRSVHPNSDIIVRAGSNEVTVSDVEATSFKSKEAESILQVTGGNVTAIVRLGADGVFSGGVDVALIRQETKAPETPAPVTPEPVAPETAPVAPEAAPVAPEAASVPAVLPEVGSGAVVLAAATGASVAGYVCHLGYRRLRS